MSKSFPIARKVLAWSGRARANWLTRHQNGFNYWIHLLGIPIAFASVPLLVLTDWPWAAGAFALGYLLQWIGHCVEGNDVGELIPLKRMLGFKTVAIAPQLLTGSRRL